MSGKLPTVVDNTESRTVLTVLSQVLAETSHLDIATGYFEVSALLALREAYWRNLEVTHEHP